MFWVKGCQYASLLWFVQVAEQLFRPLMFQLIHWFTRNTQYESPDTIALLDAILVS